MALFLGAIGDITIKFLAQTIHPKQHGAEPRFRELSEYSDINHAPVGCTNLLVAALISVTILYEFRRKKNSGG